MAIYHLTTKPIARSSGRSAVAAAAYRAGALLRNLRDGQTHDYRRRAGVMHSEIVLPGGVPGADWARDRSVLWNAAETAERRKDSRVAREIEIALPHELTAEQRLALTRDFAQRLADRYGVAVDFAIHSPHGHTDIRNHHAHILVTTRKVVADGLGEKSELELENRKLAALGLPTSHDQVREIRVAWEEMANGFLAMADFDIRIDHRSHLTRGVAIEPTSHVGVHATEMRRRGIDIARVALDDEAARRNAERIRARPEDLLTLLTDEMSVIEHQDIARRLHRYLDTDDPVVFQNALARVLASPTLVTLRPEQGDGAGRVIAPARYSTREMVEIERGMARAADQMAASRGFAVASRTVEWAIARQDTDIQQRGGAGLTEEQRAAIAHVCGPAGIVAVIGRAGAGKSTMLKAAREAWEARGYRVFGAALAGKAAEGLEASSGIASRTLASWERGRDQLQRGDVLVIDEAGMVGSKQMARFIAAAERAGAKIVLVGDPDQLQPINAGAAFRAIAERTGFVTLERIQRQRDAWQREASMAFARSRTAEGLALYAKRGAVRFRDDKAATMRAVVGDVLSDMKSHPNGSRLVLAHRRADVRALNEAIRTGWRETGRLGEEKVYQTDEGERAFAPGDRLLFRENNRDLGVKNGMLGTVTRADEGRLEVRVDDDEGKVRKVAVSMADYAAVDHGYAVTIHKSQGATVDRAFVYASRMMDRHLTYVAMTRHRDSVRLYVDRKEFRDLAALSGRLSSGTGKETTLDYAMDGYATRRGLEPPSEIVMPAALLPSAPAVDGLAEAAIAAEQARAQREAADRRQAAENEIRKQAASLVHRWEILTAMYRSALSGVQSRPQILATRRVALLAFGKGLAGQAEAVRLLHERGAEFGVEKNSPMIRVLAADQPASVIRKLMDNSEKRERERLEQRDAEVQEKPTGNAPAVPPGAAERSGSPPPPAFAPDPLAEVVERCAEAILAFDRMSHQKQPVSDDDRKQVSAAARSAEAALNAIHPGAANSLVDALRYDAGARKAIVELSGSARARALIAAMEREAQNRANAEARAVQYMEEWSQLQDAHQRHETSGDIQRRQQTEARIRRLRSVAGRDARAWAVMAEKMKPFGDTPETFFTLPVAENLRPRPQSAPEANPAAPEDGPEPDPPEDDNGPRFRLR
ncbi:Ti-type conjugative transfer relaxase TraA [Acidiphilium sp.]|uniref:Ti-type conjugative transfer relaxase TraA n=1 Tax=Acidiphilium sp. TaxID=527 RepID=UPI0025862E47|nr:Ti-type conjugative transfer relaxase TraA [Acidiphilium sp.]